ncbi:hypothetical protein VD0004_g3812 [Verticillium dahliae]|uniref:Mitochondrial large ribosomal subunit n=1 Tax=Verticillium dahliae TaxID=27337 RepID=A0A444RVZ8_VERDA|nr:hypothetical protein VdG1_06597 [Verticillium dahliae VDG1]PNH43739.1 hypothetical protein VD0004_g3812 [Verticillium dahliae]PNH76917.1 hypothetical protein VD0001_g640 [Verticillium dahliae]RXG45279.1 hypothetical protein VDGE_06695 [Verticillium dahliae]
MSAHLPSRRIALSAHSTLSSLATGAPSSQRLLPLNQRRTKWSLPSLFGRGRKASDPGNRSSGGHDLDDPKVRQRLLAEQQQTKAPALSDSIFQDEVEAATSDSLAARTNVPDGARQATPAEAAAWRLDPDPRSRVRWERKRVIQMVQRQTASSEPSDYARRVERIRQTERQMTHKSPFLETSTKKLVMLARQIQGKTLQDALTQMTYSKKKMAREVKFQLEEARDFAVVSRGMGLGKAGAAPGGDKDAALIKIKTKDGQTLKITDPSSLYVAEAWVNKGPSRNRRIEFKGRGRTGVIISPSTGISVVLKEEKTRIREHNERVAREAKRKPWVHLPNRPVTAQRPYYSW